MLRVLSIRGRPMDFENLIFKIASGLTKIITGNFKKQVTTAEGNAQSEKRSLTGRQIYDFEIRGDSKAIFDFRDCQKSNEMATTFRPSTQSGTKCYQQSLTDLLTTCWGVCARCTLKSRKNCNASCKSTLKRRHSVTRSMIIAY